MPIEIRELVIKVTVHDESHLPARPEVALSAKAHEQLRQQITDDCMRQVLAQLRRQKER